MADSLPTYTMHLDLEISAKTKTVSHQCIPADVDEDHIEFYSYGFVRAFVLSISEKEAWRGFWVGVAAGATLIAAIVTASIARAETIDGDRIILLDGDTVALPCDPARGVYPGCAERLRLVGSDAPETRAPRCEAERVAGLAARAALAGLIRGRAVTITRTGRDKYGRTLARLTVDGRDLDDALIAAGAALPYRPGRAAWADRCRHWCPGATRCEE